AGDRPRFGGDEDGLCAGVGDRLPGAGQLAVLETVRGEEGHLLAVQVSHAELLSGTWGGTCPTLRTSAGEGIRRRRVVHGRRQVPWSPVAGPRSSGDRAPLS